MRPLWEGMLCQYAEFIPGEPSFGCSTRPATRGVERVGMELPVTVTTQPFTNGDGGNKDERRVCNASEPRITIG